LKEFCRQKLPHCKCRSNAAITRPERIFIRTARE
jgi:hypothetical protein